MIITDDLVEKAVRATEAYMYANEGALRTALEAVLPDILEKCAKVADAEVEKIKDAIGAARRDGAYDWANDAVTRGLAVEAVGTAIRNLKSEGMT